MHFLQNRLRVGKRTLHGGAQGGSPGGAVTSPQEHSTLHSSIECERPTASPPPASRFLSLYIHTDCFHFALPNRRSRSGASSGLLLLLLGSYQLLRRRDDSSRHTCLHATRSLPVLPTAHRSTLITARLRSQSRPITAVRSLFLTPTVKAERHAGLVIQPFSRFLPPTHGQLLPTAAPQRVTADLTPVNACPWPRC